MLVPILTFIVVLSILVLVHEAGHYFMAKRAGIWVEEFGFGIPPRVWGKKVGETIYSINLLPFGGFVRLHGENTEDTVVKPTKAFLNKSKLIRTKIIIAGVVMNFVLAFLAFSIVYSFSGIPRDSKIVKVLDVASGSPAQAAGIISGDVIESVEGVKVTSTKHFIDLVEQKKGQKVKILLKKIDANEVAVVVTPRSDHPSDEGPLGVVISSTEIYYPVIWLRPVYGVYYGFKEAVYWGKAIVVGFTGILRELLMGQVPKDIAGPVGIFALTSEAAKVGILTLINFVGILSVNLAILNIIPFPAMDGGRLLFIGIELVTHRRVTPKIEAAIHTVGMFILILLLVAVTIGDVSRLIKAGSINGFIESFLK